MGEGWGEGLASKTRNRLFLLSLSYASRPHPLPLSQWERGNLLLRVRHADSRAALRSVAAGIDGCVRNRISAPSRIVAGAFSAQEEASIECAKSRFLNIACCVTVAAAVVRLVAGDRCQNHSRLSVAATVGSIDHGVDT